MGWFTRLCRQTGLMVHNIVHPDTEKKEISRTTEEKKISDDVTLRRTTIEEIEIKRKNDKAE